MYHDDASPYRHQQQRTNLRLERSASSLISSPSNRTNSNHQKHQHHSGSNNNINNINNTNTNKRVILSRIISHSRHVSRTLEQDELLHNDSFDDPGIDFDVNKHQILSNFEEWIKMSTDNKINSKNSWQFALIDYFHDLNVIKDGDQINFQKASATLDGCMKIYSNRIDSAATETGKLLSGLATKQANAAQRRNNNLNNNIDEGDEANGENILNGYANGNGEGGKHSGVGGEGDDEEDDEDDGTGNKKKRKTNRVVESTLVDFETIRLKKFDEELSIDPLFKKALAEFDEGGAKSLLLNTLSIDSSGRVVFDATTNQPALPKDNKEITKNLEATEQDIEQGADSDPDPVAEADSGAGSLNFNLDSLKDLLYTEAEGVEFKDKVVCPSLHEFRSALEDINKAKGIFSDFNTKMNEQDVDGDAYLMNEQYMAGDDNDYGVDFDASVDDNDDGANIDLGGASFPQVEADVIQDILKDDIDQDDDITKLSWLKHSAALLDEDLMNYFDEKMKRNWTGPEHWKVSAYKKANKMDGKGNNTSTVSSSTDPGAATNTVPRKKKVNAEIEFFDVENEDEDVLFKSHRDPNFINLKQTTAFDTTDAAELKEMRDKNCLPNDIQFTSTRLISFFQKPQMRIFSYRLSSMAHQKRSKTLTDSEFFAEQYKQREEYQLKEKQRLEQEEHEARLATSFNQADFDDFDDDYNGLDFNDALEDVNNNMNGISMNGEGLQSQFSGDSSTAAGAMGGASGLMTKRKSEYVNFSRVAKRVDIKLLKDNLWKAINEGKYNDASDKEGKQEEMQEENVNQNIVLTPEPESALRSIKFGEIIKRIKTMYRPEQFKELSTSFCFICVLHLANEHGLQIKGNNENNNLEIIGF